MLSGWIGRHKMELPTPALLLDLDKVKENIRRMAALFQDSPCKLRPHAKTHKLPLIAHWQMKAGAMGITCAKLEDVRGFVEAGLDKILVAHQVVGPEKIQALIGLGAMAEITVSIDSIENAKQISELSQKAGHKQRVLVEVDVGIGRAGQQPGAPALEFVRKISALPGLSFEGIMGYEGGLFKLSDEEKRRKCDLSNTRLVETREMIEADGIEVKNVQRRRKQYPLDQRTAGRNNGYSGGILRDHGYLEPPITDSNSNRRFPFWPRSPAGRSQTWPSSTPVSRPCPRMSGCPKSPAARVSSSRN